MPRDPADDGAALGPRIARLRDDMLGFAEPVREVRILDERGEPIRQQDRARRFFEAVWLHKQQGRYYLSYSTGDTHLIVYATGDSPYGPFTYQGVVLTPVLGWTTHHSILTHEGRWYLFFHDASLSGGKTHLRSAKVTELAYRPDGSIVDDLGDLTAPFGLPRPFPIRSTAAQASCARWSRPRARAPTRGSRWWAREAAANRRWRRRWVTALRRDFPGGLEWIRVGRWDHRTLLDMLAIRLGVPLGRRDEHALRLAAVRRALVARGRTFIVLDNHEDNREMARFLRPLAAHAGALGADRPPLPPCRGVGLPGGGAAGDRRGTPFPAVATLTALMRWNPLALDVADALVRSGV